jgi:hypothetical protein
MAGFRPEPESREASLRPQKLSIRSSDLPYTVSGEDGDLVVTWMVPGGFLVALNHDSDVTVGVAPAIVNAAIAIASAAVPTVAGTATLS